MVKTIISAAGQAVAAFQNTFIVFIFVVQGLARSPVLCDVCLLLAIDCIECPNQCDLHHTVLKLGRHLSHIIIKVFQTSYNM